MPTGAGCKQIPAGAADKYLQHGDAQGFLKPSHTLCLLAQGCSSAVHFYRKQSHRASDLHGTPKQPESLSSTVKVTRFPPFHRENWKGDGGSVFSSLLHRQLPAVGQKGKAKE